MASNTEKELIEFASPYLKEKGFKKRNKRWTKEKKDFTYVFYIQRSRYSSEDYFIRIGVIINELLNIQKPVGVYGHIWTEINRTTPEKVMKKTEKFWDEWSDKTEIVRRALIYAEWNKQNPLEKRRSGEWDSKKDPCPEPHFFVLNDEAVDWIVKYL